MALQPNTTPSETTQHPLATLLREMLYAGFVSFTYTKLDGTTRIANGTTSLPLIPEAFRPVGGGKPRNPDLIAYFDTDSMAWRSCKQDRLVSIDQ